MQSRQCNKSTSFNSKYRQEVATIWMVCFVYHVKNTWQFSIPEGNCNLTRGGTLRSFSFSHALYSMGGKETEWDNPCISTSFCSSRLVIANPRSHMAWEFWPFIDHKRKITVPHCLQKNLFVKKNQNPQPLTLIHQPRLLSV